MRTPQRSRSMMLDPFEEVDRWFDNMMTPWQSGWPRFEEPDRFMPQVELSEGDDYYALSFDLPGMKKENIQIEAAGNSLVVFGERHRETRDSSKEKVQKVERSYGSFRRAFTLPMNIDASKIEAHYEDGVLQVYLPKEESQRARQISVQSGKPGFIDRLLGRDTSRDTGHGKAAEKPTEKQSTSERKEPPSERPAKTA